MGARILTVSPSHRLTVSPSHRLTVSPSHRLTSPGPHILSRYGVIPLTDSTQDKHSRLSDPAVTKAAAIEVAQLLIDDKCDDVVVLDVSGLSQVSDFIVIASGTSDRQMRSSADDAAELAEKRGWPAYRRSEDTRAT